MKVSIFFWSREETCTISLLLCPKMTYILYLFNDDGQSIGYEVGSMISRSASLSVNPVVLFSYIN